MLRLFLAVLLMLGAQTSGALAEQPYERPLYCGALFKALSTQTLDDKLVRKWAKDFTDAGVGLMVKAGIDSSKRSKILKDTTKRVTRDMARNYSVYTFEDCAGGMKTVPIPTR